MEYIRNFAIIAHIDHGKSTLADRLIQLCGGLDAREMQEQVLDSMDLEKERGITIKAQTVRLKYKASDGKIYQLNLMDTPGHVDFAYEVSRCLAACEGSLLIVDTTQGIEAQTIANVYYAIDNNHEIIPVLNKIDLQTSDPDNTKKQINEIIGVSTENAVPVSSKTGFGIEKLLEYIVKYLPSPVGNPNNPLKALLIDSWYDRYMGIVILVRIIDGSLKKGQSIKMMSSGAVYKIDTVGYFTPKKHFLESLSSGEIGFFIANIKNTTDCKIGDTITDAKKPSQEALSGFKMQLPVVFCSLYPTDASQFKELQTALNKLKLNDSSFVFEIESSKALGFGFKCGFLGLLHLEIIQERISREFEIDIVATAPSVAYKVLFKKGKYKDIHNPADWPEATTIDYIEEPLVKATIIVPDKFLGDVLELCTQKRGVQIEIIYIDSRVMVVYRLPLNEIIFDFYDKLKSCTKGYASFDWIIDGYEKSNLVKLNILINGEKVDALSVIIHTSRTDIRGREICMRLKEIIPRQLFPIPIQAAIGSRIIARETIKALRKDVTAKLYGGDVTRKKKLLEKQKSGKKKMKLIGNVEIPKTAFISALKLDNK